MTGRSKRPLTWLSLTVARTINKLFLKVTSLTISNKSISQWFRTLGTDHLSDKEPQ